MVASDKSKGSTWWHFVEWLAELRYISNISLVLSSHQESADQRRRFLDGHIPTYLYVVGNAKLL